MIRQLAILALAAICLAQSTTATEVEDTDVQDAELLKGQKLMFDLILYRFNPYKIDREIYEKGRNYDFEANMAKFDPKYQEIVREFLKHYHQGMLPRGKIFSIFCSHEKDATKAFFRLLFHAPKIDILNLLAIWASIHLNEYQFHYILRAVLYHRPDTKYITLSPFFEMFPEMFYRADVMKDVYNFKMSLNDIGHDLEDNYRHVVEANFTQYIHDVANQEHLLNYITEDTAMSGCYFNYHLRYFTLMSDEEHSSLPIGRPGEIWFWVHRQFAARFYLERLSNNLGAVKTVDYRKPIQTGYSPNMIYPNGRPIPTRQENAMVPEWYNEEVLLLEELLSRIGDVVDSGKIWTEDGQYKDIDGEDGMNIVGNLMQGNNYSLNYNYYGSIETLIRTVHGSGPKPHNHHQLLPSALENYATSMRDPAFQRLFERVLSFYWRYQKRFGCYSRKEVAAKGIKIKSFAVSPKELVTYMELNKILLDRFWIMKGTKLVKILAKQERLNHQPYTFNFVIESEKDVNVTVRLFLGPPMGAHGEDHTIDHKNFFELDLFIKELKKGENVFQHKSDQALWMAEDFRTPDTFEAFPKTIDEKLKFESNRFGFPARAALPRSTPEGMYFTLVAYVIEFSPNPKAKVEPLLGTRDDKPLGFPMSRPLCDKDLPNISFLKVKIVHKNEKDINRTNV